MPELVFYFTPTTCSIASHIALEESGLPYQGEYIRLHKPDEVEVYRATVNPKGTIPALRIDGTLVTENVAILTYIADSVPDKKLLPDTPLRRAQCLSHMAWLSSTVHITRRMARAPMRFTSDEALQKGISQVGRPAFWQNLQKLDALYADKKWLMGDQYTVADGYSLVFYSWGQTDEHPVGELKHFTAFKDRMLERETVFRALQIERSPLVPRA